MVRAFSILLLANLALAGDYNPFLEVGNGMDSGARINAQRQQIELQRQALQLEKQKLDLERRQNELDELAARQRSEIDALRQSEREKAKD